MERGHRSHSRLDTVIQCGGAYTSSIIYLTKPSRSKQSLKEKNSSMKRRCVTLIGIYGFSFDLFSQSFPERLYKRLRCGRAVSRVIYHPDIVYIHS